MSKKLLICILILTYLNLPINAFADYASVGIFFNVPKAIEIKLLGTTDLIENTIGKSHQTYYYEINFDFSKNASMDSCTISITNKGELFYVYNLTQVELTKIKEDGSVLLQVPLTFPNASEYFLKFEPECTIENTYGKGGPSQETYILIKDPYDFGQYKVQYDNSIQSKINNERMFTIALISGITGLIGIFVALTSNLDKIVNNCKKLIKQLKKSKNFV